MLAVILGLVLGSVVGACLWWFWEPPFTAQTSVFINSTQPYVVFENAGGKVDFSNYQRTQVGLIKSRLVLNSALRNPKTAELPIVRGQVDPVGWLERNITVDFSTSPELMRISLTGKNPQELVVLVEAVRKAYLQDVANRERTLRLGQLEQLKKVSVEYERTLKGKRDTLKNLAEGLGSSDSKVVALRQQMAMKDLSNLHENLLNTQMELRRKKIELAFGRDMENALDNMPVPDDKVEEMIRTDLVVRHYQEEIGKIELAMATFKESTPDPEKTDQWKKLMTDLANAKKALGARKTEIKPLCIQELRIQASGLQKTKNAQNVAAFVVIEKMQAELKEQVEKQVKDMDEVKKDFISLESIKEEIAQLGLVTKKINMQVQTLSVEIQAPDRTIPWDDPIATQEDQGSIRIAALGGAGTFSLVLVGMALLELVRACRVKPVEEVVQG
jgi:hypothetical protein